MREQHSKKPDEARERIEQMFPDQSKAELFARHQHPGWAAWGHEVEGGCVRLEEYLRELGW